MIAAVERAHTQGWSLAFGLGVVLSSLAGVRVCLTDVSPGGTGEEKLFSVSFGDSVPEPMER